MYNFTYKAELEYEIFSDGDIQQSDINITNNDDAVTTFVGNVSIYDTMQPLNVDGSLSD